MLTSKIASFSHNLLDAKINSVLSLSHDPVILSAVHQIIQNMIAFEEVTPYMLSYLQSKSTTAHRIYPQKHI